MNQPLCFPSELLPRGREDFPLGGDSPPWAPQVPLREVKSRAENRWILAALHPQRSAYKTSLVLPKKKKKKKRTGDKQRGVYGFLPSCVRLNAGHERESLSGHTDAARETQPRARRVLHACAGRRARPQMYTGCSWAVSSLYMAAGIVFM